MFQGDLVSGRRWDPSRHDIIKAPAYGLDTETERFDPRKRYVTPPLVWFLVSDGYRVDIVRWDHASLYIERMESQAQAPWYFFLNVGFDMCVTGDRRLLKALYDGRCIDIGVRHKLRRIAEQGWFEQPVDLALMARRYLRETLDKDGDVRLSFTRAGASSLTQEQLAYMLKDPVATYRAGVTVGPQPTDAQQTQACYMFYRMEQNGAPIDLEEFERCSDIYRRQCDESADALRGFGYEPEKERRDVSEIWKSLRDRLGAPSGMRLLSVKAASQMAARILSSALKAGPDKDAFFKSVSASLACSDLKEHAEGDAFQFRAFVRQESMDETLDNSRDAAILFADAFERAYVREPGGSVSAALAVVRGEIERTGGWQAVRSGVGPRTFLQEHLKQMEARNKGLEFPRTEKTGQLKADKKNMWLLKIRDITDPFLDTLMLYTHANKMLSTYLNLKNVGPDNRMRCRFSPIMRTGRTSASAPNLQNFPKKGGLRGIITALKGKVIAATDYRQLELCSLAEHCYRAFGMSVLGDAINAGIDAHRYLWAFVDGLLTDATKYSKDAPGDAERVSRIIAAVPDERRAWAKPGNFGEIVEISMFNAILCCAV